MKKKKKGEEKACEARSTLGPASPALLSCLCTPQLADIILAALPGGVSAEVSTVTRQGPTTSPHPHHPRSTSTHPQSFWLHWDPHPPSAFAQKKKKRSPSLKSPLHHVSRAQDPTALVSMVTGKLFVSCGSK